MIRTQDYIQIEVKQNKETLMLAFERKTNRTVYDICDLNGRILKTGPMKTDRVKIPLNDLDDNHYILLVLDGDRVYNQKFTLQR